MSFASAINALKANGTAVFASAGNNFSSTTMGAPACIQNTVAVGAVYDAAFGTSALFCSESTAADKITCFSNASTVLDLLAPGAAITSDGSAGGLSTYYGTSQASPHAAGAAAVLFAANPSLTPAQVETALKATGVSIFDSRNGLSYPRIDLQAAFNSVGACTLSVAFPRQHDALFYGNSYNIAWSRTQACGGNVKIELYKGGVLHAQIAASAPSNGSFAWVPSNALPSAADYRIRITDLSTGAGAFGEDGFVVTGAPSPFVAGGAPSQVFLAWGSPGIIGQYRVLRRDATSGGFVLIDTTPNTNYTDSTVQPDRGYLYVVQRVDAYGNFAASNVEAATTFAFTDQPVAAGTIVKQVHVTELRAAIDALRAAAGLGAFGYSDDGSLIVRAQHIMQLRTALDAARSAASLPALGYGETVTSGSVIKAAHINEIRPGVQ
jgi:hypothetical protein